MKKRKQLLDNFVSLSVLKGFEFLIPLITLPYLVGAIGLSNFGLVNFANALALYFGALIQYGFGVTGARDIARVRDNQKELERVYSRIVSASVFLSLVSLVIYVPIVLCFEIFNQHLFLYLASIFSVIAQSLFPVWLFQGVEKMRLIMYLNVLSKVLFLAGLMLMVKEAGDYYKVPLLYAASAGVSLLSAWWVASKRIGVKFRVSPWKDVRDVIVSGRNAFITQFAPNLYNNTSTFFLGLFASPLVVGGYSAAVSLTQAAISLGTVLTNTFLPHLSRNIDDHPLYLKIMLASGASLTLITATFAKPISSIFFPEYVDNVYYYLQLLSVWILLIFIRNAVGINYLMLMGAERVYKNIVLYTSVFFAVIGALIIPKYEAYGAIFVIVGSSFAMAAASFWYYAKLKVVKK